MFFPIWGWAIILQLSVGDIIYFENANKHIGYEGFAFIGKDLYILYFSAITEKPLQCFFGFFFFAVYVRQSILFYKKHFQLEKDYSKKFFIEIISITIFFLIGARGGIQTSGIRPSFALIADDPLLNAISINPLFTSAYELQKETLSNSKKMRFEESVLIARETIDYEGASFENPAFPILRKTIPASSGFKTNPNIVILLLESWSAKYIGSESKVNQKEVTPKFNQLIKEGIYFNRFFATGGRTSNGLLSTLTGIPDRYGQSVLHFQESNSRLGSLPKILQQANYSSIFMTGSDLNFENIKPHIKKWGFEKILDENNIKELGKYSRGIWGFDDGVGLPIFLEELDRLPKEKPFVAVYLTISTHHPYKVPDKKYEIFDSSIKDFEYLNTLHYSDSAISEFIESAKTKSFFKNTLFILLSDHTHHRFLNPYEDRNIPLLIYSPANLKPSLNSKIGTQLDIIPTILSYINKPILFSAYGKNLFSKSNRFSYFCFGNIAGWIDEENIHFVNLYSEVPPISFGFSEPFIDKKICNLDLECRKSERKMLSILNSSILLMEKNLIFPY